MNHHQANDVVISFRDHWREIFGIVTNEEQKFNDFYGSWYLSFESTQHQQITFAE